MLRLAELAVENGVADTRINKGNITGLIDIGWSCGCSSHVRAGKRRALHAYNLSWLYGKIMICPRKVRGALVSGYQFCVIISLLQSHEDTSQHHIPIALQLAWGLILAIGPFLPPQISLLFCEAWQVQER